MTCFRSSALLRVFVAYLKKTTTTKSKTQRRLSDSHPLPKILGADFIRTTAPLLEGRCTFGTFTASLTEFRQLPLVGVPLVFCRNGSVGAVCTLLVVVVPEGLLVAASSWVPLPVSTRLGDCSRNVLGSRAKSCEKKGSFCFWKEVSR